MKVLVTRPEPDATAFAQLCRARGLAPVLAPIMTVHIRTTPVDLTGLGALAFTSANGVRAFAANSASRGLKLFAVGHATAGAARDEGFDDIVVAGGDVRSLAQAVAAHKSDFQGDVLHVAGADRAGDLISALQNHRVSARRAVLYKAEAAARLPQAAADALRAETPPEWAAFFSPRTATLFIELVRAAGLECHLGGVRAACLSEAVAQAVSDASWSAVMVAGGRAAGDMIDLMASFSAPGRS